MSAAAGGKSVANVPSDSHDVDPVDNLPLARLLLHSKVVRLLYRCLYDPFWISYYMFVVFCVGLFCTSSLVVPAFNNCTDAQIKYLEQYEIKNTDEYGDLGFYRTGDFRGFMAGLAMGALLIQGSIIFSNAKRLRREASHIAAFIFLESFAFYMASSQGVVSTWCIVPVGGRLAGQWRPHHPGHYIFWLCTTPSIVAMLGRVSGASPRVIASCVVADFLVMLTGLAASMVKNSFGGYIVAIGISSVANLFVMHYLRIFMRDAYRRTVDARTMSVLWYLGPSAQLMWFMFPLVWFLREFSLISNRVESFLLPAFDIIAKIMFTIVMVSGDFSRLDAEIEAELKVIDQDRISAESANTAKKQFMRYLFHELRVPLNAVLLGVEDLYETYQGMGDGVAEGTVDIVYNSAILMSKLLDDFLSLEKIEEGKLELEKVDFSPSEMLGEAVRTFATPIQRKNLQMALDVSPNVPELINGDPNRLRQVITNFISNAIKFTPEGGRIKVKVSVVYLRRRVEDQAPPAITASGDQSSNTMVSPTGTGLFSSQPLESVVHEDPRESRDVSFGDDEEELTEGGFPCVRALCWPWFRSNQAVTVASEECTVHTPETPKSAGAVTMRSLARLSASVRVLFGPTSTSLSSESSHQELRVDPHSSKPGRSTAAGAFILGDPVGSKRMPEITVGSDGAQNREIFSFHSEGSVTGINIHDGPEHKDDLTGGDDVRSSLSETAPVDFTMATQTPNRSTFDSHRNVISVQPSLGTNASLGIRVPVSQADDTSVRSPVMDANYVASGYLQRPILSPMPLDCGSNVKDEKRAPNRAAEIYSNRNLVSGSSDDIGRAASIAPFLSRGLSNAEISAFGPSGQLEGSSIAPLTNAGQGPLGSAAGSEVSRAGSGNFMSPRSSFMRDSLTSADGAGHPSGARGPLRSMSVVLRGSLNANGTYRRIPMVRIAVSDRGIGISKEEQKLLFRPFTQIRAGAAQKGGGTGLGLAICKRIMELTGGRIGVASQPGKGSTFFIDLPLQQFTLQPLLVKPHSVADSAAPGLPSLRSGTPPGEAVFTLLSTASAEAVPPSRVNDDHVTVPVVEVGRDHRETSRELPVATRPAHVRLNKPPLPPAGSSHPTFLEECDLPGGLPGECRSSTESPSTSTTVQPIRSVSLSPAASRPQSSDATPQSKQLVPRGPDGNPLKPLLSVMVVDDVKSNRDLFGRLLSRKGVETVSYAEDGSMCLDMIRKLMSSPGSSTAAPAASASDQVSRLPQIIMLDKEMPFDGHETARELKRTSYPGLIIGCTGNALQEDRDAFVSAGADAIVTKPIRIAQLETQLAAFGYFLPKGALADPVAAIAAMPTGARHAAAKATSQSAATRPHA